MKHVLKLYVPLALAAVLVVAVGVACFFAIERVGNGMAGGVNESALAKIEKIADLQVLLERQRALLSTALGQSVSELDNIAVAFEAANKEARSLSKNAGLQKISTDFEGLDNLGNKLFRLIRVFDEIQSVKVLNTQIVPLTKGLETKLSSIRSATLGGVAPEQPVGVEKALSSLMYGLGALCGLCLLAIGAFGFILRGGDAMMDESTKDAVAQASLALDDLLKTANDIQTSSTSMSDKANETFQKVHSVTSATNQTSDSIQSISAAIEQMSATAGEIQQQVEDSTGIARRALEASQSANQTVQTMTEAVNKISDVVRLINEIAEQTNLLALNAAIEAARAGEAGRGFAVVAEEVRKLSTQTNTATGEIVAQIQAIQDVSKEVFAAMSNMSETIAQMDKISGTVTTAVKEQAHVTGDISSSVSQVSNTAGTVKNDMNEVNMIAQVVGTSAGELKESANHLLTKAGELSNRMHAFTSKAG